MALGATLLTQRAPFHAASRPSSRRRDALLQSGKGQALHAQAQRDVAAALEAHQIAPLVAWRLRKGMSQKQLCERAGLPQPHVSRLENGKVPCPDLATLKSLALALDATLDEVAALFAGASV